MKLLLKLIVSGGLLAWVFLSEIDWNSILDDFQRADMRFIGLAFLLHLFGFLFSGLRWQKLLKVQGIKIKLLYLIDSYLVGSFFNMFMPTRIGGDIVRVNDTSEALDSVTKSASCVAVERFLGISILFFFALIASTIRAEMADQMPIIWLGLGVGAMGVLLFLSMMYYDYVGKIVSWFPSKKISRKVCSIWKEFRTASIGLLSKKDTLIWGLGYSFLLQVNVILHFWIIGLALNFNIPLIDYFFIIPIQLVILMAPAINGIGLREASSIILFGFYGVSATEAAVFSLIDFGMLLVIGLIGYSRFMFRNAYAVSSDAGSKV